MLAHSSHISVLIFRAEHEGIGKLTLFSRCCFVHSPADLPSIEVLPLARHALFGSLRPHSSWLITPTIRRHCGRRYHGLHHLLLLVRAGLIHGRPRLSQLYLFLHYHHAHLQNVLVVNVTGLTQVPKHMRTFNR